MGTVGIAKAIIAKRRPNEANNLSYPSGHTAASFSGASFLQTRYGAAYGIPAYAAAFFVGYSRMAADHHYGDDVLAGASVALLYNFALVRKYPEKLSFKVTKQPQMGYALGFNYRPDLEEPWFQDEPDVAPAQFRFIAEFSATGTTSALFQAPSDTGDPVELDRDFGNVDEPVPSTYVQLQWFIDDRHQLDLILNPFEERDNGTFDEDKSFGGQVFPADTNTKSAYAVYFMRLRYRYNLFPNSRWVVKPAIGLTLSYWSASLVSDAGPAAEEDTWDFMGVVGVLVGYKIGEKWSIMGEVDGFYVHDGHFVDTSVWVGWQFGIQWELRLGIRYLDQEVDVSNFKGRLEQNRAYLAFAFRW